jgi:hypothetical protein
VFVDIVAGIKKKRLKVIGHILKMDHEIVVKKTGENTPKGRRRMGRPSLRWLKDFEKELGETKVKIWRQKAVNREEWAVVTKVAKGLRGP